MPKGSDGRKYKKNAVIDVKPPGYTGNVGKPKGFVRPDPVTPENAKRNTPICGGKRSGKSDAGPGICCLSAGWGTDHPGVGHCKWHGGALRHETTKGIIVRSIQAAREIYGEDIDIGPHEALLQEVHRTAGAVEWLRQKIRDLEDDEFLVQKTMNLGMQPSAWLALYQSERSHLVKVSKAAIDAGVAERHVRIAEEQAKLIAMAMNMLINDPMLELTPRQRVLAPKIVRKSLLAVSDSIGTEVEDAEVVD